MHKHKDTRRLLSSFCCFFFLFSFHPSSVVTGKRESFSDGDTKKVPCIWHVLHENGRAGAMLVRIEHHVNFNLISNRVLLQKVVEETSFELV